MAQYTVGPTACTGWAPDGSGGQLHAYWGKVLLSETVDLLNNTSTIAWTFLIYLYPDSYVSNYRYTNGNQVQVSINGNQVFNSPNVGTVALNGRYQYNPLTLASGTVVVPHDSDGTKNLAVSAKYTQNNASYLQSITVSGTVALETIPRSAMITSAPAITLPVSGTVDHTVTWETQVSTFWYKVEYKYGSTSLHTSSATQNTTYTYAVPASVSEYVTNAKTMTLSVVLHTYSDSACTTEVGTNTASVTVTFSDDYAPGLTYTLSVDNSLIPSANRSIFAGIAIQYTSKLSLSFTGTGVHDATISGYTCMIDGKGYSGASVLSDPIQNAGTLAITAVVTDSRGFSTTITISQTVIAYAYPQIKPYGTYAEVQVFRCDSVGVADDRGQFVKMMAASQSCEILESSVNLNRSIIKYRYLSGSTWSGYTTISDSGDASINDVISGVFPETNAYTFEIHAEDLLGNASGTIEITVPISDIPLHLREGGHGVGIGDYASSTANRLMVGYEAHFSKPIHTDVGLALSGVDMGSSTMADLWDDLKTMTGGIGAFELTTAYGNMDPDDYVFVFIPYDDENGLIYFSLLGTDSGDLWIVHIINDTICQPFKLTGSR